MRERHIALKWARIAVAALTATACSSADSSQPSAAPLIASAVVLLGTMPEASLVGEPIGPLILEARTSDGRAVANASIDVTVVMGGGTVAASSVKTNQLGRASIAWTLGQKAGPQELLAAIGNDASISLRASAIAGAPTGLSILSAPTELIAGRIASSAVDIALADKFGNQVRVSGTPVQITLMDGCGFLSGATALTDVSGRARFTSLSLRSTVGRKRLRAVAPSVSSSDFATVVVASSSPLDTSLVVCHGAKADGITDDAPAIQRALLSLPDSGGMVFLPSGIYNLATSAGTLGDFGDGTAIRSAILVQRNRTTLRGVGAATVLRLAPKTKMRAITVNASDVTVEQLIVDGNKANRDGTVGWPNGDVVDALVASLTWGGVTAERVRFHRLEVRNAIEDGIGLWQNRNSLVDSSYSHDNGTRTAGGTGISLSGGFGNRAIGNLIASNTATQLWVAFGSQSAKVIGNTVRNGAAAGITIGGLSVFLGKGDNRDFEISDNLFEGNCQTGFPVIHVLGATNGRIIRNQIRNNFGPGIYFHDETDSEGGVPSVGWTLEDNLIANTVVPRVQPVGIWLNGRSAAVAQRNVVENNGSSLVDQVRLLGASALNSDWQIVNTIRFAPLAIQLR